MKKTEHKVCPACGWKLLPILYGYPTEDSLNNQSIIIGGCIVEPDAPEVRCPNCEWSGDE